MTAALARQKARSAGGSRGQEDNRSEMPDDTNAIAVLIRLPDLNEPASKEKMPALATAPVQPDDMANTELEAPVQPPVPEELSDKAADTAAASADEEPDACPPEEEGRETEAATWNAVTVPRPVMQLAGVLALIGMLIGAYFAIVGGGDGTVDEDNDALAGDQVPFESAEPAPLTEPTESIDIATLPPLGKDQQQELFVNPPPAEPDFSLVLPGDEPEVEGGTEVSRTEQDQTAIPELQFQEETDLANSFPDSDSLMQDDGLEGFGVDFAKTQQEQEKTDLTTPPEDRTESLVQGPEMPQLEQTVDVSPTTYPATDPSKYRYTENYHTTFQVSPSTSNTQDASPGPSERGLQGQYPDTARLNPPIEPPSIYR